VTTTLNASTAGAGGFIATGDNSGSLALQTAGTTAVTIDTSQNVGIGTTSPSSPIDVVSNSSAVGITLRGRSSESTGKINFVNNANNTTYAAIQTNSGEFSIQGVAAIPTVFYTNNTERMRIDSSGNVGINQTSPTVIATAKQLAIKAPVNGDALFVSQNSNGLTTFIAGYYGVTAGPDKPVVGSYSNDPVAFITNNTERMRIDSSGNLLVGTTSQILAGFQTNSYNGASFRGLVLNDTSSTSGGTFVGFAIAGTQIGSITRVAATSAVAYNTTSDERLKSNITDAQPVLEKLMNVKVRQFDWTGGDLHQDYGFVAQELEPTLSGVVTKGKTEEDVWQLDYSRLTPHLVKAIQELKAELDELKAKVA
jgi:hypothetical protein